MEMDHRAAADLIPSSPTNSSPSSSDLDTESTGSFFPDRSTTLGTLMGVKFPSSDAPDDAVSRHSSSRAPQRNAGGGTGARKSAAERQRMRRRRRSWWRLCRDDMVGPATSLGDFLQVERRSSAGGLYQVAAEDGGFVFSEGVVEEHAVVGGGRLFDNGRVLPPSSTVAVVTATGRRRRERLPVLLAGICSGGEG